MVEVHTIYVVGMVAPLIMCLCEVYAHPACLYNEEGYPEMDHLWYR